MGTKIEMTINTSTINSSITILTGNSVVLRIFVKTSVPLVRVI